MKFRYSVRSLGVLTLLIAISLWWWTNLPVRNAKRFHTALSNGDLAEANEYLIDGCSFQVVDGQLIYVERSGSDVMLREARNWFEDSELRFAEVRYSDVAARKRHCTIKTRLQVSIGFDATHGAIQFCPRD